MDSTKMKPSHYRDKFIALQKTAFDNSELSQLAKQTAGSFMDHYYQDGRYDEGYIDLMCEMATFSADKELNRIASAAFFSVIIEELCDDYEDFQFEAYNKVMSQVISYCRNTPASKQLDDYLNKFKIHSAEDIFNRAVNVHNQKYRFNDKPVKQIFLLSRITVGADVAITSVMIQRLSKMFPEAEFIILGSLKLKEIFGGNSRIRIIEVEYTRGGGLIERFDTWCRAVDILEQESKAGERGPVLLIDPDSRITQLGILPIFDEANYFYFNSHIDSASTKNACMAEHSNAWMNKVFGKSEFCHPKVWLEPELMNKAQKLTNGLRQSGCQSITAVNFGVGGNGRKKLGLDFEKNLIVELLKQPQSVVILDKGFGAEELANSQEIINEAKNKGFTTRQVDLRQGEIENFSHGLLAVECTIGEIAALIGSSGEYIGYDSACQHIAAAQAIPTITIFSGSNNPRFIRRWSACGETSCKVIHVDTIDNPIDIAEIINRIMAERLPNTQKADSMIKIINMNNYQPNENKDKNRLKGRLS